MADNTSWSPTGAEDTGGVGGIGCTVGSAARVRGPRPFRFRAAQPRSWRTYHEQRAYDRHPDPTPHPTTPGQRPASSRNQSSEHDGFDEKARGTGSRPRGDPGSGDLGCDGTATTGAASPGSARSGARAGVRAARAARPWLPVFRPSTPCSPSCKPASRCSATRSPSPTLRPRRKRARARFYLDRNAAQHADVA